MTSPSLPDSIEIGPFTYTITTDRDGMGKAVGQTAMEAQTIQLDDRQAHQHLAETLLHETLHAVVDLTGLGYEMGDKDEEERIVRRLAPILLLVLRTNPALVKFLLA